MQYVWSFSRIPIKINTNYQRRFPNGRIEIPKFNDTTPHTHALYFRGKEEALDFVSFSIGRTENMWDPKAADRPFGRTALHGKVQCVIRSVGAAVKMLQHAGHAAGFETAGKQAVFAFGENHKCRAGFVSRQGI